ncbi:MAG: SusC/RagA family TonB-linked outer membrane protein [Bacteroidetes bacterium]|nr:SusC/RagA family TonB-linked outer membrane protein [Bacteroidota bacterium]
MYKLKRIATLIIAAAGCLTVNAQKKSAASQGDGFSVSGIVKNAATGQPVRGVRVKYKEYAAAITDSTGTYTIKVPGDAVMLTLEGDGYQTREIAVQGQHQVNTVIYEDGFVSASDDVDLVEGRTTRTMAPYAVSGVAVNDGWSRTNETPDAYLQGKVAGLNAIRRSGTQNIGATMFLNGINSLYATNQPLIIVDGVIFNNSSVGGSIISNFYSNPLSTIDVRDIDNITVLKDASALYGSKGANGAIIISTIRAKELGTKIDFAVYGGYNDVPKNIPVMKAADYRIYLSEILKSKGMSDADIQKQPYMIDDPSYAGYYMYHNETNWQNLVMQKAYTKNVYLKVTGGDNIAKYALSLGFLNNDGLTKNTDLSKYNMRFNGDLNLSRRMTATTNLSFTFSEQNLRDQGSASETNPLFLALVKAPFLRTNDVSAAGVESPAIADKDTLNVSNPVAVVNLGQGLNKAYRFLGSVGFNYAFTKDLSLSTTVGVVYHKVRESFFVPRKGVVPDTLSNAVAYSRLGSQVTSLFDLFNDTRLTFSKTFGRLNAFSARAGVRYMKEKTEQDYGLGYNSAIDELVSVGNGVNALRKVGGEIGESKWVNSYVNAEYAYSDRYILSVGLSGDASSRFGTNVPGALKVNGNVFSMFPSVAAAWIISNEKALAGSKIDLLKLRASYSWAGNDDIGNYTAQQTYVSQNLLGMEGLVRAGIANDQLQWEQVKKLNAGLDLALLKERLQVSLDVFSNKTDKMIVYEPAPTASGFDYVVTNSGALKNTGYSIGVTGRIVNNKAFRIDAGFNTGKYNTTVTRLPASKIITSFSGATYVTQTGSTPNAFYGNVANGVYVSDAAAAAEGLSVRKADGTLAPFKGGDIRFADLNGDKIIDDNDRTILGSPNPDFSGSFFTTFAYKRISLNALFTFSHGNEVYNYTRAQLEGMSNVYNQTQAVVNRWKNNGEVTTMPKAAWGDPMGNARFSSRWIEDGSYLRLRTVTIAYEVPLRSNFFKNATVYATGNNLFTLTKYKGYDPEFSATESIFGQGVDNTLEPQVRTAQVGFRIGL